MWCCLTKATNETLTGGFKIKFVIFHTDTELHLISLTLKTTNFVALFLFFPFFWSLPHPCNPTLLPPASIHLSLPLSLSFFFPFIFRLSLLFHGVLSSSINMTESWARGVRLLSALPLLSSSSHALSRWYHWGDGEIHSKIRNHPTAFMKQTAERKLKRTWCFLNQKIVTVLFFSITPHKLKF